MRFVSVLAIGAMLVGVGAANAEPSGRCPARDFQTAAGRAIDDLAASQAFTGAVLVAIDGKPVLRRAVGEANREWHVANTVDTRFRIGSTTKTFTAVTILRLVDEGKVALDAPVAEYVPNLPQAWAGVTIKMLLSHTAGVPDYVFAPTFKDREARLVQMPKSLLALVREKPLDFPPGEGWRYSNTGFVLLGMVIEKVSGRSYADYLRDEFFTPLGMADTGYETEDAVMARRASGYMRTRDGWALGPFMAPSSAYAAGALYSTVDDLLKWDQALYGDRLVSKAGRDLMFADYRNHYGLGWQVDETWGRDAAQSWRGHAWLPSLVPALSRSTADRRGAVELRAWRRGKAGHGLGRPVPGGLGLSDRSCSASQGARYLRGRLSHCGGLSREGGPAGREIDGLFRRPASPDALRHGIRRLLHESLGRTAVVPWRDGADQDSGRTPERQGLCFQSCVTALGQEAASEPGVNFHHPPLPLDPGGLDNRRHRALSRPWHHATKTTFRTGVRRH
jgi:CubicO group peptidase (beta-lactamase class C family)